VKIGFHLPISKGFAWTHREATRLGCEVVQIFVKNPRSWAEKILSDEDRESFLRLFQDIPVVAHLSYLPNLAKIDEDPRHLKAIFHEAALCTQLGVDRLIMHCGSRKERKRGMANVAQAVDRLLGAFGISVMLENAAGQGDSLGTSIAELGEIYRGISDKSRVTLCLDTAHIFEAGYNVRSKLVWKRILREARDHLGPEALGFFHLNDSKTPLGSNVDRHWHIGQGKIGLAAFRYLLNEQKFAHLGGVMETPKMGNMDDVNMKAMRLLLPPLVPGSFS
jgi:apurinic endonuclease APN1